MQQQTTAALHSSVRGSSGGFGHVADLMITGVPIEMMDGVASYMSPKSMEVVFDKISETVEDKRLIVLSILGFQGSGKSTLLNALLGL